MAISSISAAGNTSSSTSSTAILWTAVKQAELRSYAAQKLSPAQIAQKLNCSASDIRTQAAKLGVKLTVAS
jgi:DNA-binding CsgD family transcriptional regulator